MWKYEIPKLNHKGEKKNSKFKFEKSKILNEEKKKWNKEQTLSHSDWGLLLSLYIALNFIVFVYSTKFYVFDFWLCFLHFSLPLSIFLYSSCSTLLSQHTLHISFLVFPWAAATLSLPSLFWVAIKYNKREML